MAPGERLETVKLELLSPVQSRLGTDLATAERYAELYREGADLGPGRAVKDAEGRYHLWDGIHRKQARGIADLADMVVVVTDGTARDARRLSLGANATHGLQRTDDDKRHAVNICLNDAEWSGWSDRKIAETCGVSRALVATCRKALTGRAAGDETRRKYVTKHGTEATMDVSGIQARAREKEPDRDDPPPAPKSPPARKVAATPAPVLDGKGDPVPEYLADVFGDPTYPAAIERLRGWIDSVAGASLTRPLAALAMALPFLSIEDLSKKLAAAEDALSLAMEVLEAGRPYAPCPACGARGCPECYHSGYLPKWKYDDVAGGEAA